MGLIKIPVEFYRVRNRKNLIVPALFNTSAIDLILETVPLHFQLPPINALGNLAAAI